MPTRKKLGWGGRMAGVNQGRRNPVCRGWGVGAIALPFPHILEERPLLSKGSKLIQFIYFEKDTKV